MGESRERFVAFTFCVAIAAALAACAGGASGAPGGGAGDAGADHVAPSDTREAGADAPGGASFDSGDAAVEPADDGSLEAAGDAALADGATDATGQDGSEPDATSDASPDATGNAATDAASDASADATAGLTAVAIDDCPGSLTTDQDTALEQLGGSVGMITWLYPYDGTVFPGGIAAPVLQWSQTGTPDGVYVHLHSLSFDYKGCFAGSAATQLTLDATAWEDAWSQSQGASDPLTVELATTTLGTLASWTTTWIFATAPLADDIYYNTYGSKLVPGQGDVSNGAVMRLARGAAQPTAFVYTTGESPFGPCVSCHSVSANGSMLVTQEEMFPSTTALYGKGSVSFDLVTTPAPSLASPLASTLNAYWAYSAVYPDGTFLLTSGEPASSAASPIFPGAPLDNPGTVGPETSTVYDPATGVAGAAAGLGVPYATMPMFSPDGLHVVFNGSFGVDAGAGDGGVSSGHALMLMDFDEGTMTFSNLRTIFQDATLYPGWPSFTPDSKEVVFTLGTGPNFASEIPPGDVTLYNADLYLVDVATGTSHRMDAASGYAPSGATYLPFPSRDQDLDFYPALSPVTSGGYYWIYFTSRRSYGSVYGGDAGNESAASSGSKAIWVAAIDMCPPSGTDPSHPAFYLPGQEIGTGNFRSVPALPPCDSDAAQCAHIGTVLCP